jgi:hypothetical protein
VTDATVTLCTSVISATVTLCTYMSRYKEVQIRKKNIKRLASDNELESLWK